MSNNNNNNINNNNDNNNGINGKCQDSYCLPCSGISRSGSMNGNNGSFNNNNNNNNGPSNVYGGIGVGVGNVGGIPPIQVTAKVLFGSVSAISALNAERKKKSTWKIRKMWF